METKQILVRAALIGGGFLAVYYLLKRPATGQVSQPGTSSSGVPAYDPQVQSYIVGAPSRSPSPAFALPSNNIGGNQYGDFNFAGNKTAFDFSKEYNYNMPQLFLGIPAASPGDDAMSSGGCGCSSSCTDCTSKCAANNSRYPDGRGGCMSASRGDQIKSSSGLLFTQAVQTLISALPTDPSSTLMDRMINGHRIVEDYTTYG